MPKEYKGAKISRLFAAAAIISFLFISGCGEGQEITRYPSVRIPGYSMKDYYRLLAHPDREIVANAVCNLLADASGVGASLSNKKIDKKSPEYILALNVYKGILGLLASSRDAKIKSGCLRFLQLMSETYAKKDRLIGPILKVKSSNENVRYERVCALNAVVSQCVKMDSREVREALRDRSWLVSREAYALVNNLENEELRLSLIKKYYAADAEMEKLLILGALQKNFSSPVFRFLTQELTSSKNAKVRQVILGMLSAGSQQQEILGWIEKNLAALSQKDKRYLADTYVRTLSDNFSSSLLAMLIKHGQAPPEGLFKELKVALAQGGAAKKDQDAKEAQKHQNALRVEAAILEAPSVKDEWLAFKAKEGVKKINPQLQKEYNAEVDRFALNTDQILAKYKLDENARKEYVSEIFSLKDYLVDAFGE